MDDISVLCLQIKARPIVNIDVDALVFGVYRFAYECHVVDLSYTMKFDVPDKRERSDVVEPAIAEGGRYAAVDLAALVANVDPTISALSAFVAHDHLAHHARHGIAIQADEGSHGVALFGAEVEDGLCEFDDLEHDG